MMDNEIEIVVPEGSFGEPDHDTVAGLLRSLTKRLMGQGHETSGGLLGGEYGYGVYFENDTMMMHPFCWCEADDCPWCGEENAPNFWHKPSGFRVWWYKYIGRSMEFEVPHGIDPVAILAECVAA